MHFTALVLLSAQLFAADPALPVGTQLVYRGSMVPAKDDGIPTKKEFELTLVASDAAAGDGGADGAQTLLWTLAETGRGSWLWLDHFGAWDVGPLARDNGQTGPALLYVREEGKSVIPLPGLLFARDAGIGAESTWTEGRLEYRVSGTKEITGRKCWEILVRSPIGHKRTLFVDQTSPLVVAVRETVFIGQGEQHELLLELAESKTIAADALQSAEEAIAAAVKLREAVGHKTRSDRSELSDEQLTAIRKELPALAKDAANTPLEMVLASAQKDLQAQRGRSAAAAALRDEIVGKEVGKFVLADVAGKSVTQEALAGKVTVLHFWPYRDTPLEEPYGQVGYLDFLVRKRAKDPLQVIGVTVDERVADESQRRSVAAAARKFRDFMNVGYPIVLDDGTFLKRFGDPRNAGGKLPVFVVIGKDGKVAEYRAGLYDVTPQEGLAELDKIIGKLLQ
jgi:peroxiredoxin